MALNRCAVKDCMLQDSQYVRFPSDIERAEKWRVLCQNPKLMTMDVAMLHEKTILCSKHFIIEKSKSEDSNVLSKYDVPTLFLPEDSTILHPPSPSNQQEDTSLPIIHTGLNDEDVSNDPERVCSESLDAMGMINPEHVSNDASINFLEPEEVSIIEATTKEVNYEDLIGPLDSYYRYTLCRLCFISYSSMTYIFGEDEDCGFRVKDVLEDLLHFKVSKADNYPQYVCYKCIVELEKFKVFKDKLLKQKDIFDEELKKFRSSIIDDDGILWDHESPGRVEEDIEQPGCSAYLLSPGVTDGEHILQVEDHTYADLEITHEALVERGENYFEGEDHENVVSEVESQGRMEKLESYPEDSSDVLTCSDVDEMGDEDVPVKKVDWCHDADNVVVNSNLKCRYCGEEFKYMNLLRKHMNKHEEVLPLPCQYCNRRFSNLQSLNHHIVRHSNYKPFECEHCGLRCRLKATLLRHKRTHENIKSFLCSVCGATFLERTTLRRHLMKHANLKQYRCDICGREFNFNEALRLHLRMHTDERPYKCGECQKAFRRKHALRQHLEAMHIREKKYVCEICGKGFSTGTYLKGHVKIHAKVSRKAQVLTTCR